MPKPSDAPQKPVSGSDPDDYWLDALIYAAHNAEAIVAEEEAEMERLRKKGLWPPKKGTSDRHRLGTNSRSSVRVTFGLSRASS